MTRATMPGENGETPILRNPFTIRDLPATSDSDAEDARDQARNPGT
jgi:hypothetical protein